MGILLVVIAVYIGGTFKGSMLNTLAGALAWGLVNNSLNLLGVNARSRLPSRITSKFSFSSIF